jgi:hypothetical protein
VQSWSRIRNSRSLREQWQDRRLKRKGSKDMNGKGYESWSRSRSSRGLSRGSRKD